MNMSIKLIFLLVAVLAFNAEFYGPERRSASALLGDIAVGAIREGIGRIRNLRKGIRQHIRQRMCEIVRQGKIYVEPCENGQYQQQQQGQQQQYPQQQQQQQRQYQQQYPQTNQRYEEEPRTPIKEEVIIEEVRRPHRHHRNRHRNRHRDRPHKTVIVEETVVQPVIRGGGRRQQERFQDESDVIEHRVQPETVVKEMEDEGEPIRGRRPLPGGNRRPGGKAGKQTQNNNGGGPHRAGLGEPCQTNRGIAGLCMPPSYCYSQYSTVEDFRSNICELSINAPFLPGRSGICCPKEEPAIDALDLPIRVPQLIRPTSNVRFISLEDINTGAKEAQAFIAKEIQKENNLIRRGMVQRHGTMQSMHQAFFGGFDPVQFRLTKGGFISLVTTVIIMNKFKLSKEDARDGLTKYSIENTDLEQFCIKEPDCFQTKYRTMDGSCNNLQRPLWGKSNTAFERLLPPEYNDGLHEPRQNVPEPRYTLMLMQWGQFMDHDLTLAASTRAANGQGIVCCDGNQNPIDHHACFPIAIPRDDRFYSRFNQRCMHFVRNSPSPRTGCSLGHREQMNTLTHVIDASMVYGSSLERAKELRTFQDGRMKTSFIHNQPFLPFNRNSNTSDDCTINPRETNQFKCFEAGDGRVNEQTGLTMIHTLLLREHNRIAGILREQHPNRNRWNDEVLYQETRRIVAAEIQHITYNEWFPIVLGRKVMKLYNILPKTFGYTKDYNPRINPNVLNEFATAAYRFHSLIQGTFLLMDENGQIKHRLSLHHLFNNPKTIYMPNAFDQYLNGFTTEPSESWDKFFSDKITNHLFEEPNSGFGMDLVALNIQRGRDHGLPGYNSYRKLCGLHGLRSFRDLEQVMESGSTNMFSRLYKHVDDIDLFIAGAHERPLPDALIGPTFACIVAEQARRSKMGDRFWYENGGLPQSFRPQQLNEIRKASLASLICDNADSISKVQPLAFLRPGGFNQKVPCDQISRMNLDPWQNEKLWDE
ncbi:hypothetical protein BLOT_007090 [Blomia tropicalis]|nr:hypothetical protein BLOT_007090 [Blomia tropicalis]